MAFAQMMANRAERAHPRPTHLKKPQGRQRQRAHNSTPTPQWTDLTRDSHMTCLYSLPIDQTTVTLCAMQHQDHLWLAFRRGSAGNSLFLLEEFIIWSHVFQIAMIVYLISQWLWLFSQRLTVMIFLMTGCFVCLMKTDVTCFPILKEHLV